MIRKKVAGIGAAVILAVTPIAVTAAPANAMTKTDITMACQYQYGAGWSAYIVSPYDAFSWRCGVGPYWSVLKGVNLWGWCNYIGYGGAYTNNTADRYSWYCA